MTRWLGENGDTMAWLMVTRWLGHTISGIVLIDA